MKYIWRIAVLLVCLISALWYTGVLQLNAATFNIKDVKCTTYWDYDEEDRPPFPIVPSRSRQCYEDGLYAINPDFNTMLSSYIAGEKILGISAAFEDGIIIESKGTDFEVCIYPGKLDITKKHDSAFTNTYLVTNKSNFEVNYKRPHSAKERYHQRRSLTYDAEIEIKGVCSSAYANYKIKEIYLYYVLDALRNDLRAHENFLAHEYLDSLDIMFIANGIKLDKDHFLNLSPNTVNQVDWIRDATAADYYRKEEPYVAVLVATVDE